MKKITLLFFMSLLSFCGYSQLALEDFEDNGNALPVGWTKINVAGLAQQWNVVPHSIPQTPAYGDTGHVAYLNRENMPTGQLSEDWLVTKQFPAPANGQLRFQSRLTDDGDDGSTYKIMIHTGNTPDNPATYAEMVPEMTELQLNPDPFQQDYLEKVFSLPASIPVGQQVYIAFVMKGDNGDRWLIDNVMVVAQCFDVTGLGVISTGTNTAVLDWDYSPGTTAFMVDIVPAASAPTTTGFLVNQMPPYTATQDSNGNPLVENMDYKYYVKALCGTEGSMANWVGPFNFSTVALGEGCGAPITITQLPFLDTDNTANYGDVVDGSPGGAAGCGSNNGYLNGNDVFYSYTPTASGNISIDVTGNGAYSGIFVYTSCANVGTTCAGGAVTGSAPTPLSIPTFAVTAGQQYILVISTWATPQTTPYTLTIQQVNCAPPVGLPTTDIGTSSADLSWTNPSGATSWQLVVQDPGDGIPQGAGVTVTDNTELEVTAEADSSPLVGATPYEYWVRADCGNNTFSAWAGPYAFNTRLCEAAQQCEYTFIMTDQWGDGWNGNTMTVSQNGISIATIGSTMAGAGPVSVTVPVCTGVPLQLAWNTGGDFPGEVGVQIKNNFNQVVYTKPFGVGTQGTILYQDATISCTEPECIPPTGLYVTDVSTDTVKLGWAGAPTGNWNYYVVPAGSPAPTSSTPGNNTTTNPAPAGGLTASTNYQFYVQMVCDGGNSAWAGPFAFTTAVCPLAQQCVYDFILTDDWGDGWNGNTMAVKQNGVTIATLGPGFTGAGPTTVSVAMCDGMPFELFWNAGGNFAAEVGVQVVNNFDQIIYTKPFATGSQNTSLFTTMLDCDNPACVAPTGLTAYDFEVDSAMLEWDGEDTGNWEVIVVPAGSPEPAETATGIPATTNPFEVPLAAPATNYDYYVRMVCGGGEVSDWAGPYEIHSAVCDEADQCNYVFELMDSWGDGWNGNTMTIFQAGVPVATIGAGFTTGESFTVEVPLCPGEEFEIFWNTGGNFANEVGLTVYTPFEEDVYTKAFNSGTPGTTLFTGEGDCSPPPCPKPQDLFVDGVDLHSAQLNWTEMGSATTWEVYVVPFNSPAPLPADSGISTIDEPVTVSETVTGVDFTSGTTYQFYVRAICGGTDGNSNWSGPITFTTLVENDDCADATPVPVNSDIPCDQFVTGTITGSTGSSQAQSCITWMDIEYDVWYSFVAVENTHAVSINNQFGATFQSVIYEGDDCGSLTELACGDDSETVTGLTPGETYYVRVYTTFLDEPTDITSFEICVNTPPPPIRVSQDEYTLEQLVTQVLIGSECAQVSNVQSGTGTSIGVNGIGYFDQNDSTFPMSGGVVLVTGDAMNAPGPNDFPNGWANDFPGWDGDADLETAVDLPAGTTNDATWLSFDFVTLIDELNFDFIFASEEYDQATFECNYSDSFAFILTDLETGVSTNLAVLPSTDIPIQVTNIHPDNGWCGAANEGYFGQYNDSPYDPINFNGQTALFTATSPVIPNHAYNIKLVIANEADNSHNSAVFLREGSFDIGEIVLPDPYIIAEGNGVCQGGEIPLDSGLDPDIFEFQWYQDDQPIPDATGPSYIATETGNYKIEAIYGSSTCGVQASVLIEFYPPVEDITNDPAELIDCNASGFGTFDLTQNTDTILEGTTGNFTVNYYLTEADAILGDTANAITNPEAFENTVEDQQTIWVGIDVELSATVVCHGVRSFNVTVQDLTPEFTITEDFSICDGASGTITVTPGNYDEADVTYTWTRDGGAPLAETTGTINVTMGGTYEVTINNDGCTAVGTTVVTIIPLPIADDPADVTSCDSYELPALSPGNVYYTGTGGTGTMMNAGEVVTGTMDIYILASTTTTPVCTSENMFTVTIVPSPVAVTPGDQTACTSYTLPALAAGNYYTGSGGTGTMLNAGDAVTSTQPIFVYVQSGTTPNCTGEASFNVTIVPVPEADQPANVTACDSYVLPALSAGNNYYTGPDATGTMLSAGETITSTQQIHVFTETGTTPNCTDDNVFTVTIINVNAVTPGNQTACDSYTLPALAAGNYYTGMGGTGTMLSAGETVTSSQTLYVYVQSGTTPNCTDEESFTVTITPTPVADAPGDVAVCDSYTLPSLGVGNYYTGPGGTGTQLAVGSTVNTNQTIYVYAQSGTTPNCWSENSFTVTIIPTPVIAITEGCNEDNQYMLEAIFTDDIYTPDNASFAWTDASGTSIGSGASVIVSATGTYYVTVTPHGDADCPIGGEINVMDTSCQVQRGISPNGDEYNQSFDLTALNVKKLSIFNRYGSEVYSFSGNYTDQWEGQGSGGEELPTGTYFYMIERDNGESRTGWVYINREN